MWLFIFDLGLFSQSCTFISHLYCNLDFIILSWKFMSHISDWVHISQFIEKKLILINPEKSCINIFYFGLYTRNTEFSLFWWLFKFYVCLNQILYIIGHVMLIAILVILRPFLTLKASKCEFLLRWDMREFWFHKKPFSKEFLKEQILS